MAFLQAVAERLRAYRYTAINEAQLQDKVYAALRVAPAFGVFREVPTAGGRFDLEVRSPPERVVIELKVRGGAAEVERQAMRYALQPMVTAVIVASTSHTLIAELRRTHTGWLGGKPLVLVTLESFQ